MTNTQSAPSSNPDTLAKLMAVTQTEMKNQSTLINQTSALLLRMAAEDAAMLDSQWSRDLTVQADNFSFWA
jgi:hypothetical protein